PGSRREADTNRMDERRHLSRRPVQPADGFPLRAYVKKVSRRTACLQESGSGNKKYLRRKVCHQKQDGAARLQYIICCKRRCDGYTCSNRTWNCRVFWL